MQAPAAPSPAKQKMLQKPVERPSQLEEETEEEEEEEKEKVEEEEDRLGDPSRAPGADSERRLDPDLLLPFSLGWVRECITRQVKNGPQQVSRHSRSG